MKRAIRELQEALRCHFGKASGTGVGAVTLSIAHDRVELTNEGCVIVARGPVKVATVLRRRKRTASAKATAGQGGRNERH